MGSATEFGLRIAEYLKGEKAANKIRDSLQIFR